MCLLTDAQRVVLAFAGRAADPDVSSTRKLRTPRFRRHVSTRDMRGRRCRAPMNPPCPKVQSDWQRAEHSLGVKQCQ